MRFFPKRITKALLGEVAERTAQHYHNVPRCFLACSIPETMPLQPVDII